MDLSCEDVEDEVTSSSTSRKFLTSGIGSLCLRRWLTRSVRQGLRCCWGGTP
ncbi:hypothetical protein K443DRAFT_678588 [Laccaria amethystina LaAM-08-1]|uniref:Uncharacterized protein n=1 Tax=Laccaria amethystina LaAM-08-1 TaxID=1095629 RepID=A0A0C9XZL6_9AGAR|nr:hypothetical protein K443DRAFT_678588 [Laccaria amethystina LaAM-08-1]